MDLNSSFHTLRVLFTSIKCNFFQKVAFYTNQTDFLGWLFSKGAFWPEKVETNGHLIPSYFFCGAKLWSNLHLTTYAVFSVHIGLSLSCEWWANGHYFLYSYPHLFLTFSLFGCVWLGWKRGRWKIGWKMLFFIVWLRKENRRDRK